VQPLGRVGEDSRVRADTKIGIVLRDDLAGWQALNVTAFLASAVAAAAPQAIGEPYEDGSGTAYMAMFGQPVLVYAAGGDALRRAHLRAVERELAVAVYIDEMFKTGNDEDNRATVRAHETADLPLVGIAVHGPRNVVDKVLKGLALHR
jgi:hypothetical protein